MSRCESIDNSLETLLGLSERSYVLNHSLEAAHSPIHQVSGFVSHSPNSLSIEWVCSRGIILRIKNWQRRVTVGVSCLLRSSKLGAEVHIVRQPCHAVLDYHVRVDIYVIKIGEKLIY